MGLHKPGVAGRQGSGLPVGREQDQQPSAVDHWHRHGSGTRDYCRARATHFKHAPHELASTIADDCETEVDPRHLFVGRHARLIDGSAFQMADTPAKQLAYPQNPAQDPGIGFSIARFVAVISLATACVIDAATESMPERKLARQLSCGNCSAAFTPAMWPWQTASMGTIG